MTLRSAVVLIASLIVVATAQAQTTWHVDDDNCPGPGSGTEADPFCKIQDGIAAAVDGDNVLIAEGTYNEAVTVTGRANLTLQGSGCTVTTILAPGHGPALSITSSSGIVVTGFRLSSELVGGDSNFGAIRIFESNDIFIAKNLITDHSGNGIILYGSSMEVVNNIIVQVGDDGIRLEGFLSPLGNSALIYNNTIADNRGGSGVGLWLRRDIDTATAFNNIFFNNDFNIGVQEVGTVLNHDFNVISTPATDFFGFVSRNANEPDCDPMFVNSRALDYHIMSGSCAENAGTASFLGVLAAADDYEGDTRPSDGGIEIGADEIEGLLVAATIDIKPGSCPNSLNRDSHGLLPVALLGSVDFDAGEVDVPTVRLSRADGVGGEVAPNEGPPGPHSVLADVAAPFEGEECDCHELTDDGFIDLSTKFRTDDVVAALELNDLPAGALVPLVLRGNLLDGTTFASGSDCVRLVPLGTTPGVASRATIGKDSDAWSTDPGGPPDFDGDGDVGILDLLTLLSNWGSPATSPRLPSKPHSTPPA